MTALADHLVLRPAPPHHEISAPVQPAGGRWLRLGMVAVALVLLLGTAWFAFVVPATPGRRTRTSGALVDRLWLWRVAAEHAPVPRSPLVVGISLIAVSSAMFAACAAAVAMVWRRNSRGLLAIIYLIAASCSLLTVAALPTQTSDVYDYTLFARVVTDHNGRAFRDVPDRYPNDPIYPYSSHQYTGRPDNKLPVWTATSIGVAAVAGEDPVANLLAMRFALACAGLGSIFLLARILRRVRAPALLSGVALLALNPIVLVYGPSKTDSLMVFLMLAGIAAALEDHEHGATALLVLSALVKLISAPVLVLYLCLQVRRRGWRAGLDVAVALAVAVGTYLPFSGLSLAREQVHLIGSSGSSLPSTLSPVAGALFVVILLASMVRLWQAGGPAMSTERQVLSLLWCSVPPALFVALFLTRLGLPWYLLTVVAVAAVAGGSTVVAVVLTVSWSSFLFGWWYAVSTRTHPLPDLFRERFGLYLGPPVLVALALAFRAFRVYGSDALLAVDHRPGDGDEPCPVCEAEPAEADESDEAAETDESDEAAETDEAGEAESSGHDCVASSAS
ncbi:MAG: glycosyltransferase [Acidimicrobiales bacterium]|nr:glycosyltransferase [Acidimicrobiales bacterium]